MSGHTPGPWIFRDGSVYADCSDGECIALPHTRPGHAAAATSHDWDKYGLLAAEESANARLIATAPDLLDCRAERLHPACGR